MICCATYSSYKIKENEVQKEMKELRIPLMMEASLLQQIDTYRFDNRIGSRGEAMRKLLREALNKETPAPAGQ
jgi:metal-responsive CopG/Arc/MetJ family transcriptional regulator